MFFFSSFFTPTPTPPPSGSSLDSKVALQTGTGILSKPLTGSSSGATQSEEEEGNRGGSIAEINTSQKHLGDVCLGLQCSLSCSFIQKAESPQSAASVSIILPLIYCNALFRSQMILRMAAAGQPPFGRGDLK